jgi:hypothetical protein
MTQQPVRAALRQKLPGKSLLQLAARRRVRKWGRPGRIAEDARTPQCAENAARERGRGNGGQRSPVAGQLFDETEDRLTPSHANKRGGCHRYYVSHRLVRASARVFGGVRLLGSPLFSVAASRTECILSRVRQLDYPLIRPAGDTL